MEMSNRSTQRMLSKLKERPKSPRTKIRVMVQVDNFLAGGLENVVLDSILAMNESNLECVLLVLGKKGKAWRKARKLGIQVVSAGDSDEEYLGFLEAWRPDVAILHYSTRGSKLLHLNAIPVLEVIHNTYVWFSDRDLETYKEHSSYVSKFIAVSEFVQEYSVRQLGLDRARIEIVNNAFSSNVQSRKDSNVGERRDNLPFEFLMLASINHQKNHLGAIRAFAILHREFPETRLRIVGPVYEKRLLAQIRQEIRDLGLSKAVFVRKGTSKPHSSLLKADAFLSASFFEGGQLTFLEALSLNVPVVSTRVGLSADYEDMAGVVLVDPPERVLDLRKPVHEFESNSAFEGHLAAAMKSLLRNYARPVLKPSILESLTPSMAYRPYSELVLEAVTEITQDTRQ